MASIALIWAWSQLVIMTAGWTDGLASLTHWRKKVIVAIVPFDASIQVTGTPK
jgi:hypothetical protein